MCVDIQIHESGTNYFAFWVGIHFSVSRIHYISTCPLQQIMNTVHEIPYLRSYSFGVVADSLYVASDSFQMTTDTVWFANPASK
jgi:hypothetical protein